MSETTCGTCGTSFTAATGEAGQQIFTITDVARITQELEMGKKFHDLAVKERDLERLKVDRLTQERDEAHAIIKATADEFGIELCTDEDLVAHVRRYLHDSHKAIETLTQERDEALANRPIVADLLNHLAEARRENERLRWK